MNKPYIICVDDEKNILDTLVGQIKPALGGNFSIETAESGPEALELIEELTAAGHDIAVVVSDQIMPGMTGDQFLIALHQRWPLAHTIMLTGQSHPEAVMRAVNEASLYRYLTKPWDKMDLLLTLEEAAHSYLQNLQVQQQTRTLQALFHASQVLSEELNLDNLVPKLVELVALNACADRVVCLLLREGRVSFAQQYAEGGFSLPTEDTLPYSLIRDIIATPKSVILRAGELAASGWATDPYLQRCMPKALLCHPLLHHERLIGFFYLENHTRYFNGETEAFLNLFAGGAAISLEKAHLYSNLEEQVALRTQELTEQKRLVDEKNQDILDSLRYAHRIQHAMLPSEEALSSIFPESFVLYKPKDIVSGDFYWLAAKQGLTLFAVVDCTGHGVPGAMLAVLGCNLLHQLVAESELLALRPAQLLNRLDALLVQRLSHEPGNRLASDGMDIALCTFDAATNLLRFAGAQRPLYLFRQGQLQEFKSEKRSIGSSTALGPANYQECVIELLPGDSIFLYTDGLTDQFGGELVRKFSQRRLQEILSQPEGSLTTVKQSVALDLQNWQAHHEQTDDILLVGIRFTEEVLSTYTPQAISQLAA